MTSTSFNASISFNAILLSIAVGISPLAMADANASPNDTSGQPSSASQNVAAVEKPVANKQAIDNAKAAATLRHYLESVDVMQAKFTQIVANEMDEELDRAFGDFTMAKPGKFLWDYQHPDRHQLISNGETVWQYDIELEQVNTRAAAQVIAGTPAEVLSKPESLHRDYIVRDLGEKDGIDWIQLHPRDQEASFEDILIGLKANQLQVMRFIDKQEQHTTIHFQEVKTPEQIDHSIFDFKAPEGVEVVAQ